MLEALRLIKNFGTHRAVDDISFTLERGEVLGFLGPNGAGKTTTMRMLAGCLEPDSGSARIANYDCVAKIDSLSRRVAMKQASPVAPKVDFSHSSKLMIREYNVWLTRKDKKDIQLTRRGTEEDAFIPEFRYSPNKRFALGFQSTRVIPRKIPLLRSSPKDQVQPTIEFINYPNPGDPLPQRRPILFDPQKKSAIPVDESQFLDSWSVQF